MPGALVSPARNSNCDAPVAATIRACPRRAMASRTVRLACRAAARLIVERSMYVLILERCPLGADEGLYALIGDAHRNPVEPEVARRRVRHVCHPDPEVRVGELRRRPTAAPAIPRAAQDERLQPRRPRRRAHLPPPGNAAVP